ncbi:MAG: hypothetical protein PUC76_05075 [Clostridia bacterium]|nr:hypothetical protein [Clostridia bacterium]
MTNEEKILEILGTMQADINGMKADMNGMKADINGMKADMNGMKGDMNGMKADMNGMKTDMNGMKADILKLQMQNENVIIPQLKALAEGHEMLAKRWHPKTGLTNWKTTLIF